MRASPESVMRSVALGAMSAVLMTMLASLTLLPALLGFVGRNIDRLGLETTELVHRLRDETLPAVARDTDLKILTTGLPPLVVDFADYTSSRLPWFIGSCSRSSSCSPSSTASSCR